MMSVRGASTKPTRQQSEAASHNGKSAAKSGRGDGAGEPASAGREHGADRGAATGGPGATGACRPARTAWTPRRCAATSANGCRRR